MDFQDFDPSNWVQTTKVRCLSNNVDFNEFQQATSIHSGIRIEVRTY